jgi:hypothetical protein
VWREIIDGILSPQFVKYKYLTELLKVPYQRASALEDHETFDPIGSA